MEVMSIKKMTTSIIIAGLIPLSNLSLAQDVEQKVYKLGERAAGTVIKESVTEGSYSFLLEDMVNKGYRIETKLDLVDQDTLTKPEDVNRPKIGAAAVGPALSNECQQLSDAIDELDEIYVAGGTEQSFHTKELEINQIISTRACAQPAMAGLERTFNAVVDSSKELRGPYELPSGSVLTLTVSRTQDDGKDGPSWAYELSTGLSGEFRGSWGIGLIPNNDDDYFSAKTDDNKFIISRAQDHGGIDPTAGIFYTYLSNNDRSKAWTSGPTAGLGIDQENLTIFGGWNWTYHENFGVSVGLVVHEQKRLKGEFTENQIIAETLTPEALSENVYKPNGYVGLSMRF